MAFFSPRTRLPWSLKLAAGKHPVPGGIGAGLAAAMLCESIYFTRNEVFGRGAPYLLVANAVVAVLLGAWVQCKARRRIRLGTVLRAFWAQLTVQMMMLLAYMPRGPEDRIGVQEVVIGLLLSGGFALILDGPYAFFALAVFGAGPKAATRAGTVPRDSPLRGFAVRAVWRAVCAGTAFACIAAVPAAASGWRGIGTNPPSVIAGAAVAALLQMLILDSQNRERLSAPADREAAAAAVHEDWLALALAGATVAVHAYRALG
jgi:hypothetical protein